MNEKKKDLYIPINVPEREDFVAGFGVKELSISGIAMLIAIVVAVAIFTVTQSAFYAVGAGSILVVTVIVLIRRDRFDESIIDKIRFVIAYAKAQKKFEYVYYNIYEGKEDEKDSRSADNR